MVNCWDFILWHIFIYTFKVMRELGIIWLNPYLSSWLNGCPGSCCPSVSEELVATSVAPPEEWAASLDTTAASEMMDTGAVVRRGVLGTLLPVPSSSCDRSIRVSSRPKAGMKTLICIEWNENQHVLVRYVHHVCNFSTIQQQSFYLIECKCAIVRLLEYRFCGVETNNT